MKDAYSLCESLYAAFPEARLETRNPTHFKHVAIFVHRVAPIPGSTKGKIGEKPQGPLLGFKTCAFLYVCSTLCLNENTLLTAVSVVVPESLSLCLLSLLP